MIGDDLEQVSVDQIDNIVLLSGHLGGSIYFEASNDNGATHTARVEVADSSEEGSSIRILRTGEIVIALTAGVGTQLYISLDFGVTWALVDDT